MYTLVSNDQTPIAGLTDDDITLLGDGTTARCPNGIYATIAPAHWDTDDTVTVFVQIPRSAVNDFTLAA